MSQFKWASILTIAFFCLPAFSDGDQIAPGDNSEPSEQTSTPVPEFKAANFFQPLRTSFERNPKWPDRLSFEPKNMSALALRQELAKHPWRVLYHCSGQPIAVEKLKTLPNGVQNPGLEFSFTNDGKMLRKTFRFRDAKPERDDNLRFDKLEDTYLILSAGKGQFQVEHKELGPVGTQTFSVLHVKETDEIVIEVSNPNEKPVDMQKRKVCANGELAKELYISKSDFKN